MPQARAMTHSEDVICYHARQASYSFAPIRASQTDIKNNCGKALTFRLKYLPRGNFMAIMEFFLRRFIRRGHLRMIDADGRASDFGNAADGPQITMRIHDKTLPLKFMFDFLLHLGEAYMDGRLTLERGTISDLLELFSINSLDVKPMPWQPALEFLFPLLRPLLQQNSLTGSRKNIAHHYDLSADFFKLFLDNDMQYSCAYFTDPDNDIDTAQLDKKRRIAQKLMLKEGMRVLDIGCGFGGMAIFLAKNYGVEVTGITLSQEQYRVAVERAEDEGLNHLIKIRLLDYREETATYDRIVSVGMFEHVGAENFKQFFAKVKALLKDDGVALLHSIGRMDGPGNTEEWLLKYIFPGAYAPALSEVLPVIEKSGLWATDIEILRLHYAYTLKLWHDNFDRHRDEIAMMYDEKFCRMWEFFLAAGEMDFRYLSTMVFQIQLSKGLATVPITRDYMYQEAVRDKQPVGIGAGIGEQAERA
jgi:cyclopropane-fatty-acyl-phospholipid synthase